MESLLRCPAPVSLCTPLKSPGLSQGEGRGKWESRQKYHKKGMFTPSSQRYFSSHFPIILKLRPQPQTKINYFFNLENPYVQTCSLHEPPCVFPSSSYLSVVSSPPSPPSFSSFLPILALQDTISYSPGWPQTPYVVKDDPERLTLLSLPPQLWDSRCVPQHPGSCCARD